MSDVVLDDGEAKYIPLQMIYSDSKNRSSQLLLLTIPETSSLVAHRSFARWKSASENHDNTTTKACSEPRI